MSRTVSKDKMDRSGCVVDLQSGLPSPNLRNPLFSPDGQMDVVGYTWVQWRIWMCRLGALLSLGTLLVLFHWRPRLAVRARCRPCPAVLADVLIITDGFGRQHVVDVQTEETEEGSLGAFGDLGENECRDTIQLNKENKTLLRYYIYEGSRFVWLDRKGAFCSVGVLNEDRTCSDLHSLQKGLSLYDQSSRRQIFGPNLIDVPVKSYLRLLFEEVLNPFYVFQIFSIILWSIDDYYYYASCIFFISVLSISVSLYEIRKQSETLHEMARLVTTVVVRRQSGEEHSVSSVELVPGDCILIPQDGLVFPCDAALLSGECLVNESMLTGESVPVLKTPLPGGEGIYKSETERRHTIFCGTHIIQTKGGKSGEGGVAIVTKTGFLTAKGSLISSILYPEPGNFRFYQDSIKFMAVMALFAFIGTLYSFVVFYEYHASWRDIIFRSLDVVTIAVPPALPAALTIGTIFAQRRLKKLGVFCISPPRINASGKVSMFCFDKTGTLTEDGLDVWGVMEATPAGFSDLVSDPALLPAGPMLSGLACAHTVTLLKGRPLGDPLELKMMDSTGWTLHEPEGDEKVLNEEFGGRRVLSVMRPPLDKPSSCEAVATVQRFPFSSVLQRMSVVTATSGGRCVAFMKGSPEMVASLCHQNTVPPQFSSVLKNFASEGLRVLALAYRTLDDSSDLTAIKRGEIERDMTFVGMLMLKNLIKPESPKAINVLRLAHLRTVMVTGDNLLTAVNVAKNCGMIGAEEKVIFISATPATAEAMPTLKFSLEGVESTDSEESAETSRQQLYQGGWEYHLAISGKSFAVLCDHFRDYLPKVLMKATIFARMAPDQKTELVKELQDLHYSVGMCGDGANDCGALRASDAGISLSEAEASVASPFTSKISNISCVPLLISEGRCSLVTSFSLFRYMAMYSMIQFLSVLILYSVRTSLGDFQFLYFDIFLVTVLAVLMGLGGPSKELHTRRPPACLLSLPVLGSVVLHACALFSTQLGSLFITTSQTWYVPLNTTLVGEENLPNMVNTGVFSVTGYQYIFIAVVLTKGYPHKLPLYRTPIFLFIIIGLFSVMTWMALYPGKVFGGLLALFDLSDMDFKLLLVALAALNFLVCFVMELLIDKGLLDLFRCRAKRPSKKKYKLLDTQLAGSTLWPPLNQTLFPSERTVINCS